MPYFYDINRQATSSGSANTLLDHLRGATIANQETVGIYGVYAASRFLTAGGAQLNVIFNSGTAASGGTGTTPQPKNARGSVAAQSTWFNDVTAITAGASPTTRLTVGFAQTGGMGGYVPIVPTAALQMMPNGANPVDIELASECASVSVAFGLTLDIGEGI